MNTSYIDKLKQFQYKVTAQRLAILDELEQSRSHFRSAEDILASLRRSTPSLNLSTLYRNLEIFQACGFLHHMNQDGRQLFKLLCSDDHHHHLICTRCGKTTEFEFCPKTEMEQAASREHFRLMSHTIDLFGICAQCQALEHKK